MTIRLIVAAVALGFAPVAVRAADDDNPYKAAKIGDYVTYKMSMKIAGGNIPGTITRTVAEKSEKEATIKTAMSFNFNGKMMAVDVPDEKIDLTKPYDPTKANLNLPGGGGDIKAEKLKDGKEKIKVNGKDYDTTWTSYKLKGKILEQAFEGEAKAWVTKDISTGLVKMEMTADIGAAGKIEMTMEMTENGNKPKK